MSTTILVLFVVVLLDEFLYKENSIWNYVDTLELYKVENRNSERVLWRYLGSYFKELKPAGKPTSFLKRCTELALDYIKLQSITSLECVSIKLISSIQ